MMKSSGVILYICAGLLLSGGVILGTSTAWCLLRMSYYFWLSDFGIELGAGILYVSGSMMCLPACWIATMAPHHPRSLPMLGSLMCLVSVAMVMLATGLSSSAGMARAIRTPASLNASMLRAMAHDDVDCAIRSSFVSMQTELRCCGVNSHADWYEHRKDLPPACCGRVWNGKRDEACMKPVYTHGCLRTAMMELRNYLNSVTMLAYSIILVLSVTLIAAAYTLVNSIVECKGVLSKQFSPLRISCLAANAPLSSAPAPAFALQRSAPPMATLSMLSPIAAPI